MRSPDHSLSKSVLHMRQVRILRSVFVPVVCFFSLVAMVSPDLPAAYRRASKRRASAARMQPLQSGLAVVGFVAGRSAQRARAKKPCGSRRQSLWDRLPGTAVSPKR
jgi:hypothetical protein